jgi:hypothetical protein
MTPLLSRLLMAITFLAGPATHSRAVDQPADGKLNPPVAPQGLVVGGERFTVRQVVDHRLHDAVAFRFSVPEEWRDSSQVYWEFGNINMPMTIAVKAESPANEEAFFLYEPQQFFTIQPDGGFYRDGYTACKVTKMRPTSPAQALASFIQRSRGQVSNLKFVGNKDLPDLPKSLQANFATNQRGVAVKVTYQINGKDVEEEYYAVYFLQNIPAGKVTQINWGLGALHSFRAPVGMLERRREVYCAITKSMRIDPDYAQRAYAIKKQLIAIYQRNMKANLDSIKAAGELSKHMAANSDAFLASVDRSLVAGRNPSGVSSGASAGGGEARSATDKQDDYIRGVGTVSDPLYGTSQHSLTEQYHWTDGYGNYRNSNDGTYDPNKHENGDWQLMPLAR